jgi:aminoglycoside N3'-acetyltransferase
MARELPVSTLVDDLRRLGVAAGDVIMVHASLRAIGPVERGADGVLQALDAAVANRGTLLMYVGARDDWGWVNSRPEHERAALLAGTPPFEAATSPADPDIGVLAEIFRRAPGTRVSDHPEGRFAARGRLADHFVCDVPWDDYYGPGSPLERLVEERGRVLRLGADVDTVTLLHHAEYLADVPDKRRVRRHRVVSGSKGAEIRPVACLDDEHGIVDYPGGEYFGLILEAYLELQEARRGQVGKASSELLDADAFLSFGVRWMTAHLRPVRARVPD